MLHNLLIAIKRSPCSLCSNMLDPPVEKLRDFSPARLNECARRELVDHLSAFSLCGFAVATDTLPMLLSTAVFVATKIYHNVENVTARGSNVTFHFARSLSNGRSLVI